MYLETSTYKYNNSPGYNSTNYFINLPQIIMLALSLCGTNAFKNGNTSITS